MQPWNGPDNNLLAVDEPVDVLDARPGRPRLSEARAAGAERDFIPAR